MEWLEPRQAYISLSVSLQGRFFISFCSCDYRHRHREWREIHCSTVAIGTTVEGKSSVGDTWSGDSWWRFFLTSCCASRTESEETSYLPETARLCRFYKHMTMKYDQCKTTKNIVGLQKHSMGYRVVYHIISQVNNRVNFTNKIVVFASSTK